MHTLRAPTLQGLILSSRNFTRWFVRLLSPKRCAEFSWFFVDRVLLIISLWITIFRNLKRPIHFKKISAHRFEDHICTNKLEEFFFFFKKIYFKDLKLFSGLQNHWYLRLIFFHKKSILYFFQVWLFNFNIILKTL